MDKIQLVKSYTQECHLAEDYIKRKAIGGSLLQILEAGCGNHWLLDLKGIQFRVTGVDLDENALNLRKERFNDLNEAIVGDLRFLKLANDSYDIIYSAYVLEHVEGASRVLDNFYDWLKPEGIVVLIIPDRNSVQGFFTRFTPLWLHFFYKRYIRGLPNAGKTGYGPYPTFHERIVSRSGIHEYCRSTHFTIKGEYGLAYYLDRPGVVPVLVRLLVRSVGLLSFGRLEWKYNGLLYILEKTVESRNGMSTSTHRRNGVRAIDQICRRSSTSE